MAKFSTSVRTTEAMMEMTSIDRQPGPPPSGLTSQRPNLIARVLTRDERGETHALQPSQ